MLQKTIQILSILLFFSMVSSGVQASRPLTVSLYNTTLLASDSIQPFWFWANRQGTIEQNHQGLNLTSLYIGSSGDRSISKNWNYSWGSQLIGGLARSNYFQINQLFAGISFHGWEVKAGLFHEPVFMQGLSASNGNLAFSNNARPYPMIRLSTRDYLSVPYLGSWLKFKAEYDEGILNEKRYISNTRLHHKSLYAGIRPGKGWIFNIGIEHFVMWGGVSDDPAIGIQPHDFKSYLRYITGSPGDEDFLESDQQNVAGNQYGTYQIELGKTIGNYKIMLNLSHPFDDFSGVNWFNWRDNLIGLYLETNEQSSWLTGLLYEWINTRNQSLRGSLYREDGTTNETDNYFNHGKYISGATYHFQTLCSPLFGPVILRDGISYGLQSTRFLAHHIGAKGNLGPSFQWKTFFTCTRHLGTYSAPLEPVQNQEAVLLDLLYHGPKIPFNIGMSMAFELKENSTSNLGWQITLAKTW